MSINKDQIIKWECNNWYLRNDGFIQICSQDGGSVILNKIYTKVWTSIDYESSIEEIWDKVKDDVTWDQLENAVEQFSLYNLVQVVDAQSEFDVIFG